ncbi:MAG: substrate-binding domain-containing protein, partial [Anaerolineaceae bacterium]|nr:substrate-binding domain-containing protein [Anaerolineaceae bacterium]
EYSSQERLTGYRQALANAGILYDPELVVEGDWSATAGYQLVSSLLSQGNDFSAVFAQNDRMAVGAVKALQDSGVDVPQEVSVIGFDDMPLASYFTPPLTTMQQNMTELGAQAARLLIRTVEQPKLPPLHIRIPAELILRSSTAALSERRSRS